MTAGAMKALASEELWGLALWSTQVLALLFRGVASGQMLPGMRKPH